MKYIFIFFLFINHCTTNAMTGNDIYQLFNSDDIDKKTEAMAFTQGVASSFPFIDAYNLKINNKRLLCVPENVTFGQFIDVVNAYLKNNPASRNLDAYTLYLRAIVKAWPCE